MNKTTELFCLIDDFCQQFEPLLAQRMVDHQNAQEDSRKRRRSRPGQMTLSEMSTIVVLFHTIHRHQFKHFLLRHRLPLHDGGVCPAPPTIGFWRGCRAMRCWPRCSRPLKATAPASQSPIRRRWWYAITCVSGHHKVFKNLAQRGKSSTGCVLRLQAPCRHQSPG